ncbi:MAG: regulatory protein RecX [Succinivibrio sp.]
MLNTKVKHKDNDAKHALDAALRLLTRREYSKQELYSKLLLRFEKEAATEAVKKCIENNWQSESRYSQMLMEHLVNQCYGQNRVYLEFSKKGVKPEYYRALLEEYDFLEIAVRFLRKKADREKCSDYSYRQKILSSLARRGFPNSLCVEALRAYLCDDPDDNLC